MLLLDGKLIAKKVEEELIEETKQLSEKGITPKLVTISTVKDESSYSYIKSQMKVAKRIGIDFELLEVKADNVFEILSSLNQSKDVHGIMIAHPVDKTLDELRVLKSINPEKDVEGRTPENLGKLMLGKPSFLPCTAEAVVRILTEYSIDTKGKNITIVGRSTTVGKPLSMILLLKNYNATVTICHTGTVDLKQHTRNADILVVATGKAMLINSTHVKEGAVVVDVGINFVDGKLVGDVDFDDVKETVNAITPVPGGVGPVTTVLLMKNVVDSAKRIAEDEV
ncbi:MAG: methylenetetrahydrofolate dehydrogenase / methenyltetrahydrofolate cyclohydrolase [Thermotogaceae bacterium]|nr:methylenetetrahydrofolate dehydrogenase / methenyltetrahydrofolate cyclohydrolase [Thermotogaceae bacterium]MDN5338220.1 methylenetetrahydrofolate dehydrogenase / methenyltetrahydrofolate cyclohydrolase [Thermotogaceae bacterium]